nr:MAG TPA: hypothetical protein [Caudoviricetes sp.]
MESDRKLLNYRRIATPGGRGLANYPPPMHRRPLSFFPAGIFWIRTLGSEMS